MTIVAIQFKSLDRLHTIDRFITNDMFTTFYAYKYDN